MTIVLTVLGIALALLAGTVVVILIVPVRADVIVTLDPNGSRPRVSTRVRWWFVSWSGAGPRSSRPERPRRRRTSRRRPWHRHAARARAMLTTPGFAGRIAHLAAEVLRALLPRRLDVRARIGFDDPATTGRWFGAASAWLATPRPAGWHVAVTPEFDHAGLSGDALATWRVRPGALLWPLVTFAGSPVVWRAGWAALRAGGS